MNKTLSLGEQAAENIESRIDIWLDHGYEIDYTELAHIIDTLHVQQPCQQPASVGQPEKTNEQ